MKKDLTSESGDRSLPVRTARAVRESVAKNLDDCLELIETMVNVDSGADSPAGILAVEEILAANLKNTGFKTEWRQTDGISHFRSKLSGGCARVVLLGHADTVFRTGTVQEHPYRIEKEVAYGPGVADMKGGLAVAATAVKWMVEKNIDRPTIEFIVVGDEETRAPPPPFLDELSDARACLVLECGRPEGGFVISRKGGLWAEIKARGHAAHAGVNPESGCNAITMLCREVLRIAGLDGQRDGLTVVPGLIAGGTAVNVVPDEAETQIDIRSPNDDDLEWVIAELARFEGVHKARLELGTQRRWPAMSGDRAQPLAGKYRRIADQLAINVHPVATGGMSDGNWFSERGIATLDGLGPIGGLDHGPDEYMDVTSIPDRTGLLAGLIAALNT